MSEPAAIRIPELYEGQVFRLGDRVVKLTKDRWKAYLLFVALCRAQRRARTVYWLLRYRLHLQFLSQPVFRSLWNVVILECRDSQSLQVALWLRGRCGGTLGARMLAKSALWVNPRSQAEYARAFRRMGCWAQWRQLKQTHLIWLAPRFFAEPGKQAFARRLENFSRDVASRPMAGESRPLQLSEGTPSMNGKPAKPTWLIRLVLDRISFHVSKKQSSDRMPK